MKPSDKEKNKVRLQVFLSRNGVCSRREAFDVIQKGYVTVNGEAILEPSFSVDFYKDRICVQQKPVKPKKFDYVMLNKPKGYVTTMGDRFAKKTVYDLLPKQMAHLSPVGRLDRETEGLLLLTNNGDVANRLTHPRYGMDKTYYVIVQGNLSLETRKRLERGVYISGQRTAPSKITEVQVKREETSCKITIHEGKKRQIRIMFGKLKHKVVYLKRLIQGPLKLGNLKTGRFRELSKDEIQKLLEL